MRQEGDATSSRQGSAPHLPVPRIGGGRPAWRTPTIRRLSFAQTLSAIGTITDGHMTGHIPTTP